MHHVTCYYSAMNFPAKPVYLVIPAAGLGMRMRAVNPELPKEMLPIGGKPVIQYALAEGFSAGIRNIVLVISNRKEVIRQYCEDRHYRERLYPLAAEEMDAIAETVSFTFLYQEKPLGECDAISCAAETVMDHPVAIIYPDNIYFPAPGALRALTAAYRLLGSDLCALVEVSRNHAEGTGNSGRVDIEHLKDNIFRIRKFHQKGAGHFVFRFDHELRTCGISLSGPGIFEYIERLRPSVRDREFTDAPLRSFMLKETGLLGCRLPGVVFDVGNPAGYELCLKHLTGCRKTENQA